VYNYAIAPKDPDVQVDDFVINPDLQVCTPLQTIRYLRSS